MQPYLLNRRTIAFVFTSELSCLSDVKLICLLRGAVHTEQKPRLMFYTILHTLEGHTVLKGETNILNQRLNLFFEKSYVKTIRDFFLDKHIQYIRKYKK